VLGSVVTDSHLRLHICIYILEHTIQWENVWCLLAAVSKWVCLSS